MKEDSTPFARGPESSGVVRLRDEISGLALDTSQPLMWRRTGPLAAEFELRQGEAVFGEMEPAYMAGMDSTGECLGRSLEFHLESGSLLGIRVDSRASAGDKAGPEFRGLSLVWGRITASGGEVLRWRHAFPRMADHVLIDSSGGELLRLRPAFLQFGRTDTWVMISAKGWEKPDLAELLLLTWFLRGHAESRWLRSLQRSRKRAGGDFP